ncbi:hypothetical protein HYV74_03280 [Candidatus Uhrbacteria bacterium]|nr:hypothetical protein [Candidatus Uhrbacteria bacterium]
MPKMLGEFTEEVLLPAVERIVQTEIAKSEHRMKAWVEERLADLRAEIVLLTRKEDHKVLRLVDMLRAKKLLTDHEVAELLRMEPFPRS